MAIEHRSVESIFMEALELPSQEERAKFVEKACGRDHALLRRVRELLDAENESSEFLEEPAFDVEMTRDQPAADAIGKMVGPYKLLQQIGEGGMGIVYMAEQLEPVQRRVAIKIIKPGMDSRQVFARFEAERQALAMMDHPNIAKVLDAGTTEVGHPYFVMELVKGVPLTQYCDDNHLEPRERLQLFVQVCDAVQHAHQKGIIHRDIKPSNVLVAEYDHQAVPKIIDFGVAKALNQRLTEKTMFTQYGQIVGTPEYMSPEQAKFNQLDIDTRSDIYSLGVLLYELLSGETPFDRQRLRSAAFDELVRIIREEEPPKPSTRLKSSATLPAIAAARRMQAPKLNAMLRGELDLIVMKALDKDRARRYDTAREFSQDIRRYLNDEPVQAKTPSLAYRAKKFYQQNKGVATTAIAIVTLLLVGSITTSIGWIRAAQVVRERDIALESERELLEKNEQLLASEKAERNRADKEAERATKQAERAEYEAEFALAVNEFWTKGLLESMSPLAEYGFTHDVSMRTALDQVAERLEVDTTEGGKFANKPNIEATIRRTMAKTYWALGKYDVAKVHAERALDLYAKDGASKEIEILETRSDLGQIALWNRDYVESERQLRVAMEGLKKKVGENDVRVLRVQHYLGSSLGHLGRRKEAIELMRGALVKLENGGAEQRIEALKCKERLAAQLNAAGDHEEALALYRESIDGLSEALGANHPITLSTIMNLSVAHHSNSEKVQLSERAAEGLERVYGPEHSVAVLARSNQGAYLLGVGRSEDAIELLRNTFEVANQHLERGDLHLALLAQNLAEAYRRNGDREASLHYEQFFFDLDLASHRYGRAMNAREGILQDLRALGRYKEASDFDEQLVNQCDWMITSNAEGLEVDESEYIANLVYSLTKSANWATAERLAHRFITTQPTPKGEDGIQYYFILGMLGQAMTRQGRADEGLNHIEDCVALRNLVVNQNRYEYFWSQRLLGECLIELGRLQEAELELLAAMDGIVRTGGPWGEIVRCGKVLRRLYRRSPNQIPNLVKFCESRIADNDSAGLRFVNHVMQHMNYVGQIHEFSGVMEQVRTAWRNSEAMDKAYFAWTLGNLTESYIASHQLDDASKKLDEFEPLQQDVFGESDQLYYWPVGLKGTLRHNQAEYQEAERYLLENFRRSMPLGGDWDYKFRTAMRLRDLYVDWKTKDPERRIGLEEVCRSELDADSRRFLNSLGFAVSVFNELGEFESAEEFAHQRLERQLDFGETATWQLGWTYGMLTEALCGQGKLEEASTAFEKFREYQEISFSEFDGAHYWMKSVEGLLEMKRGNLESAESLLKSAYDGIDQFGDESAFILRELDKCAEHLAELYTQRDKQSPGSGFKERAKEWSDRVAGY